MKLVEWMRGGKTRIETGGDKLSGEVNRVLRVKEDGAFSVWEHWMKYIGGAFECHGKEVYCGTDEDDAVRALMGGAV